VPGKPHYFVNQVKKNYEKVRMKADAMLIKNNINLSNFEHIRKSVYAYIPAALLPYMYIDQERWSSELRRLSIMFVNLGIELNHAKSTEGLAQI
jgi:adenylate cyclase 10